MTAETTPYGRRRDARVAARLAADGRRLVATGHAVRGRPGRRCSPAPVRRTRCSRRSAGPGATTGGRRRPRSRQELPWRRPAGEVAARWSAGSRVPRRGPRGVRRRRGTDPTSTRRAGCRCTSSTARSTRARCSPTWPGIPRRPGEGARASSPSCAGASSTPTCSGTGRARRGTTCAATSPRWPTTRGPGVDRLVAAWREGRTGYPLVDAGHAAAARRGLDAQPGPHGHRQLPGQGPARVVAGRRAALPRPPARRRPRVEQPRLAVGGRHRQRRVAVLPGVPPGHPGAALRPRGRLRAPLGARAAAPAPAPPSTSRGTSEHGYDHGYPRPIVDHDRERREALDRYHQARNGE